MFNRKEIEELNDTCNRIIHILMLEIPRIDKELDKINQKIINLSGETGVLFKELDKITPCYECKHLIYKNEEDCEKTVISNTVDGQTFENIQRKYYCPKCHYELNKPKQVYTNITFANSTYYTDMDGNKIDLDKKQDIKKTTKRKK